jgi:hypothetical protein
MKKYFILLLLAVNATAWGQFKLSGKITNYVGDGDLLINIPVVFGFFTQNSVNIPIAKNGSFKVNLPVKSQKIANLIYQGNNYLLLLNNDKSLIVELDAGSKGIKIINGSAQAENSLLQKVDLNEYPAFLEDDRFSKLTIAALNNQLLKPYYAARDRKIATVNQSAVNPADKKLIAAEVKYTTYNNLHELTDVGAENPATLNKLVADIYSKADIKPLAMPAGPAYYAFINNYLQEIEKKTSGKANTLLKRWESAVKYLPAPVAEQYGYQLILRAFNSDDKSQINHLSTAYLKKFPAGVYAADVKTKVNKLK